MYTATIAEVFACVSLKLSHLPTGVSGCVVSLQQSTHLSQKSLVTFMVLSCYLVDDDHCANMFPLGKG